MKAFKVVVLTLGLNLRSVRVEVLFDIKIRNVSIDWSEFWVYTRSIII